MENKPIKNKRKPAPKLDRIPLSKASLKKVDAHIVQIESKREGVFVTRKLYIEYILESLPEKLSISECGKLAQKFFDEEKFLKFLMNKVKESKKTGEVFEVAKFLDTGLSKSKSKARNRKKTGDESSVSEASTSDQNQGGNTPKLEPI